MIIIIGGGTDDDDDLNYEMTIKIICSVIQMAIINSDGNSADR